MYDAYVVIIYKFWIVRISCILKINSVVFSSSNRASDREESIIPAGRKIESTSLKRETLLSFRSSGTLKINLVRARRPAERPVGGRNGRQNRYGDTLVGVTVDFPAIQTGKLLQAPRSRSPSRRYLDAVNLATRENAFFFVPPWRRSRRFLSPGINEEKKGEKEQGERSSKCSHLTTRHRIYTVVKFNRRSRGVKRHSPLERRLASLTLSFIAAELLVNHTAVATFSQRVNKSLASFGQC